MTDDNSRLAVLIDADNTSPKLAKELFEELAGYGTITVKRAYGDWTNPHLNGWKRPPARQRDLARSSSSPTPPARTPPTRR